MVASGLFGGWSELVQGRFTVGRRWLWAWHRTRTLRCVVYLQQRSVSLRFREVSGLFVGNPPQDFTWRTLTLPVFAALVPDLLTGLSLSQERDVMPASAFSSCRQKNVQAGCGSREWGRSVVSRNVPPLPPFWRYVRGFVI